MTRNANCRLPALRSKEPRSYHARSRNTPIYGNSQSLKINTAQINTTDKENGFILDVLASPELQISTLNCKLLSTTIAIAGISPSTSSTYWLQRYLDGGLQRPLPTMALKCKNESEATKSRIRIWVRSDKLLNTHKNYRWNNRHYQNPPMTTWLLPIIQ